jgi:hypothetical protein
MLSPSVIVHDLDILWPAIGPNEADAPLVVDANAVLSRTIPFQLLQPIARGRRQVTQSFGIVQLPQLALRNPLQVRPDPSSKATVEQRPRVPIGKRTDHPAPICTQRVMNVKRT